MTKTQKKLDGIFNSCRMASVMFVKGKNQHTTDFNNTLDLGSEICFWLEDNKLLSQDDTKLMVDLLSGVSLKDLAETRKLNNLDIINRIKDLTASIQDEAVKSDWFKSVK